MACTQQCGAVSYVCLSLYCFFWRVEIQRLLPCILACCAASDLSHIHEATSFAESMRVVPGSIGSTITEKRGRQHG